MSSLKKTPLHGEHLKRKAQMAPFGGWEMPIQYAGILAEHKSCRVGAAIFDICHMGEFSYRGEFEKNGLEKAFTFSVSGIPIGKCRYGFILNPKGGIEDDLIVYRLSENELMIVVNATTSENDFKIIRKTLKDKKGFTNISGATAKLDIQGPLSRSILAEALGQEVMKIPYFGFTRMNILGEKALVSRTGYTGELGYEIYIDQKKAVELWNFLLKDQRLQPAGLGARDILRIEMGYSLYGSDIDSKTTPLEAGLDGFVDFTKDFTGKKALLKQKKKGLRKSKIAFRTGSRRSPRHDYDIYINGEKSGAVTSGCFSPILSAGIGLGFVKPPHAKLGEKIVIRHEGVEMDAEIVGLPFYRGGSIRL